MKQIMDSWYKQSAPMISFKEGKSLLHNFFVYGREGLTINPYQGCHHRCGYCYATYDWSPEFYDHIYTKINASNLLYNELKKGRRKISSPVMISSATDAYQPAEMKYGITRECVKVLQKFRIPYYIFTKSIIIERDLELHRRYADKCFIVWSITTCEEKVKRIIEPGTPNFDSIFEVIKKFSMSGVQCVINIDPIIPFITDSKYNFEQILNNAVTSEVRFISSAILRLRADIWQRVQMILHTLNKGDIQKEYEQIYNINDFTITKNSLIADHQYCYKVLNLVKNECKKRYLRYEFPKLINEKYNSISKDNSKVITILDFIK